MFSVCSYGYIVGVGPGIRFISETGYIGSIDISNRSFLYRSPYRTIEGKVRITKNKINLAENVKKSKHCSTKRSNFIRKTSVPLFGSHIEWMFLSPRLESSASSSCLIFRQYWTPSYSSASHNKWRFNVRYMYHLYRVTRCTKSFFLLVTGSLLWRTTYDERCVVICAVYDVTILLNVRHWRLATRTGDCPILAEH